MAKPQRKEVSIFNFSFLDILACTVGALTFILVLLMVTSVAEVTSAPEVQAVSDEIAEVQNQLDEAQQLFDELTIALAKLEPEAKALRESIAASQQTIADAQQRKQAADQLLADSRQVAEDSRSTLKNAASEIGQLEPALRQLRLETARLATEVDSARRSLERIEKEYAQLEQGLLDREQLVQQRKALEQASRQLEEQIAAQEQLQQEVDDQATNLQEEAALAAQRRAKLLAELPPVRDQQTKLQQQLDEVAARMEQIEQDRASAARSNSMLWTMFVLAVVALVAIIGLLAWRLLQLWQHMQPLKQAAATLHAVEAKRNQLQQQVESLSQSSTAGPQSVDEAIELKQQAIKDCQQRIGDATQVMHEMSRQAEELEQQIENEQFELSKMNSVAAEEKQKARQNAKQIGFRVPLLRTTKKQPVAFDCYQDRVAKIDLDYFKVDMAMSKLLTEAVSKPMVALDRQKPGEPIRQIDQHSSTLVGMLRQINARKEFMFATVRPSGFEAFRRIRQHAWDNDMEVGWEPLGEGLPIMSGTDGSGSGPGVQ